MEASSSDRVTALLSDEHGLATLLVEGDTIVAVNAAMQALFGVSPVHRRLDEVFHGPTVHKLRAALADRRADVVELQVGPGGKEPLAVRFLLLPEAGGRWALLTTTSGATYTQELTDRLFAANDQLVNQARILSQHASELEEARARLERLGELREQFLAAVSHDLRSPLTAIRLLMARLERHGERPTTGNTRRVAQGVVRCVSRMDRLIANLLSAAQLEEGALALRTEPLALSDVAREVIAIVAPLAEERRVFVRLDGPDGPDTVLGDELRLYEVLSNLLSNALRYAPPESAVTIAMDGDGSRVRCRVLDQGPGVPVEERERIFDRFRRHGESAGVAGLGLFICRKLVELHGGSIRAEEAPGGGACFTVELPAATSTTQATPRRTRASRRRRR